MPTIQVRDFMSSAPYAIGAGQPLSVAHALMRKHRIRHLPVLSAGKLVGLLSLRELYLVETLDGLRPETTIVAEAMTNDPYITSPGATIGRVAREMAVHGHGAAVVVEGDEVAGIFTTIDALRALGTAVPIAGSCSCTCGQCQARP
jgi:acetoin utilization protein AcuB